MSRRIDEHINTLRSMSWWDEHGKHRPWIFPGASSSTSRCMTSTGPSPEAFLICSAVRDISKVLLRGKKEQQGHFTLCGFDIILSFGKWDYLESSQLKYWNMYWDILGHDSFWWQTINWTSLKQLRSHCIQEAIFPNLCASQCHMDHIGLWRNMSLMNLFLKYFWTSGTIFMYKKDYYGLLWYLIHDSETSGTIVILFVHRLRQNSSKIPWFFRPLARGSTIPASRWDGWDV